MFIIKELEKVRHVIEENPKQKLIKHKKLSNSTILEINNCPPLEILKLYRKLAECDIGE